MKPLENKVALVTGAGSGIGREIAFSYAAVVISDVNEKGGGETVEQIIEKGGQAQFMKADTSIPAQNERSSEHS